MRFFQSLLYLASLLVLAQATVENVDADCANSDVGEGGVLRE